MQVNISSFAALRPGIHCGVMLDTKGPEIRTGTLVCCFFMLLLLYTESHFTKITLRSGPKLRREVETNQRKDN
jgi:pyruvate kinase